MKEKCDGRVYIVDAGHRVLWYVLTLTSKMGVTSTAKTLPKKSLINWIFKIILQSKTA